MSDSLKLTRFLVGLLIVNVLVLVYFPTLRYRSIVIHHSASLTGNLESLRGLHRERGWYDAAYHLVLSNGTTDVPLGHLEATRRFLLWTPSVSTSRSLCNISAIHLCIIGDYDLVEVREELKPALGHVVATLQRRFGIPDSRVMLHRDCNATLCPGDYITAESVLAWAATPDSMLSETIREQQIGVLRQPSRTLAIGLVLIDVIVLLALALRPLPRDGFA